MLKNMLLAIAGCGLLLLLGCQSTTNMGDETAPRFTAHLDTTASIGATGAELSLEPSAGASSLNLALRADGLSDTKSLIGYIAYDPASWHLSGGAPALLTEDQALLLCVDRPEEGRIYVGWVLANYGQRPGLNGSLELCSLSFAPGAAHTVRAASKAPGSFNKFDITGSIDSENIPTLNWKETNVGDGDNNGEVNISDISPLGFSFGSHPDPTAPADDVKRDADYDSNGEVNISDMTPIGANLGTTLGGYAIFSGPDENNLTEQERFARTAMFPTAPKQPDGELFWVWTGAAITADTTYRVVAYDLSGVLGQQSNNTVTLTYTNPQPNITGITEVTFDDAPGWFDMTGADYTVLLTELAVDDTAGNAEPLEGVVESIQLRGMVTTDMDPGPVDGSEQLIWYISEGAGLAQISNAAGSKGLLVFNWDSNGNNFHGDRGRIVVEAQVPGSFALKQSISFALMSIESLTLEIDPNGAGPVNVNAGDAVPFIATGTFDFDGVDNGNEYDADLTPFVNWGALVSPGGTPYSIDTLSGILDTTGAGSGAEINVTCEFPRTDNIVLYDNQKRTSDFVTVNIN
jgi:hypothetical protein